ncbi:hypothetical protein V5O48_005202 [Marasmius crinis-equi]|uniref:Spherulation-specific family 4 n=1 Tax=Marasmius crinis-equi TaxID=585013 RepID=A0ABR3FN32_9AGAR
MVFLLFTYPFQNVPCGGWKNFIDIIHTHPPSLPLYVVINPDSGSGPAHMQPNFDWPPCIAQLKNASTKVHVVGYVHTSWGAQPQSVVNTNVSTYAEWDGTYRPEGIYFDEIANDAANLTYHRALADKSRELFGNNSVVILNPGTVVDPRYSEFADIIITDEKDFVS